MCTCSASAQNARTFQNFFIEGSHLRTVYGDVGVEFSDFDAFNILNVGGRIGFPIGEAFELGAELDFVSFDVESEFAEDQSGLSDLAVTGRYLVSSGDTDISIGGGLTLPIGDEDIGQGEDVNINIFGALRHITAGSLGITGVLGIDFFDQGDDYDSSVRIGGGIIYPANPNLQLIGELTILTDPDFALLSFGVDYMLNESTRLRPALGAGLDDGAPDLVLVISLLLL